ncbi:MAG TPA: 2-isopropylmalate synthase [Saccharofermentans sp.]|nr:2-isopropylmalate synthase [Saccharofermentans sp.]
MNTNKYEPMQTVQIENRTWPSKVITQAPEWCSVDLRDGNQALEVPMNLEQKIDFFNYLVKVGFKTIEIGFPAASDTDYNFTRYLIENNMIPEDVAIQVLTQSRQSIIDKTMSSLHGAKKAIVHLYNSTSKVQREYVFGFGEEECIKLAVDGARMIQEYIDNDTSGTQFIREYSPESFSSTETDFAIEICNAVLDCWKPTPDNKVIINLPETVEVTTPNIYAEKVELVHTHLKYRESVILCIHTHNDRGTGIASSELGLLAGAQRVEGTLFGNGERTGNADIITLALNMMMQGVEPGLDFRDINEAVAVYEDNTGMHVSERHPYSGKLVFSAFSGSHQDAIKKCMERQSKSSGTWSVAYLPIDPKDIGRSYEPIIRINSQSGKGGVAYVMEQCFGLVLPRSFQKDFISIIKSESEKNGMELLPQQVFDLFDETYINVFTPYMLEKYTETDIGDKNSEVKATIRKNDQVFKIHGKGNGLLDAFVNAFSELTGISFSINMYNEHSMNSGTDSAAITYVELRNNEDGNIYLGAGVSSSVTKSSIRAIVSGINRMIK